MVSEFALGAALTIGGIVIGIIGGVIAWVVKKLWDMKEDLDSIRQSYGGSEYGQGHLQETQKEFERVNSNLDDLQDLVASYERRRQEGQELLCDKIDAIVSVLEEEGFNGSLPETSDD